MNPDPPRSSEEMTLQTTTTVVHSVMRFLWLLRRRKTILAAAVIIVGVLGGIYFATAPRVYRASAAVRVRQTSPDAMAVSSLSDRSIQDQMATFQELFTTNVVLQHALDHLEALPPEINADDSRERAMEELAEMLRVNTLRRTEIIEVSCDSEDPQAAVDVINSVVAAYLDYMDRNHQSLTSEMTTLLGSECVKHEKRLRDKEAELLDAKRQCADFGISEKSQHPLVQNVIKANELLEEVRHRRIELEASLSALRRTITSGGDLRQHLLTLEPLLGKELLLDAVGLNAQDASAVRQAEQTMLEDQSELRALQHHLGPNHPRVVALTHSIQSNREYMASFQRRSQERLQGMKDEPLGTMLVHLLEEDLARTWQHERDLMRQYQQAEARAVQLDDRVAAMTNIEREVERLRSLYETLFNRIANIDINRNYADVRVSVVTGPVFPDKPVRPRLAKVAVLCVLFGFGVGSLAVYTLDVIDDRFRSPEELQEQLRVPVLAMVRKHDPHEGCGIQTLQVYRAPSAVESEAFRTLRTTLAFSGQECNRVVVTSSEPSDGKTTVLCNLGVSYAQAGKRTLLIDCDLRKPGLTSLFQLRGSEGVSEILRGQREIAAMCEACVQTTGMEGLDVIPSGRRPPDASELLTRDRFSDLLAWAESKYDQVLIDSPPVLAAADPAIAGRMVDGVIVVVQPEKNHRRLVIRAFEGLSSMGVHILGIVANAIGDENSNEYYGYGGYGYGYGYGYGHDLDDEAPTSAENERQESAPSMTVVSAESPSTKSEQVSWWRRAA